MDIHEIRNSVLQWLSTMAVDEKQIKYKFSKNSGDSLFSSCFALFILDLFKETDNLSERQKIDWSDYINSFQKKEDGLFYPEPIYHHDKERAVYQVTSFCLSALSILEKKPRYRLAVVDKWRSPECVEKYLSERGCHLGMGGSGNKAMFQAIFLTHEYEETADETLKQSINAWFAFHDKHQNEFGFWGKSGRLYYGVQNAFHQFVIYDYWNRTYHKIEKIVETIRHIQGKDGHFSPIPGGNTCKDYDAIHFLTCSEFDQSRRVIFDKIKKAMFLCQNNDGGFCENKLKPIKLIKLPYLLSFAFNGYNSALTKYRITSIAKELLKAKKLKQRKWVKEGQPWNESTLWDTWFRMLTMAEISVCLDHNLSDFRFHKHIGLGYFKK
ncbi:MAG: hypothetical protein OQK82_03835 [Candidatus Pacearchaeota archaeon]|nr:hypothetical protein [Candidatus Pacearchaeota archaeon]